MVSDKPSSGAQKKRAGKKKANSPIFDSKIAARLRRQIDDRWPNLGRQLASVIQVSREKVGDIYSSGARFITEHKEAFEDRLAERKAQARVATRATQQQSAPARPIRRGVRDADQRWNGRKFCSPCSVQEADSFLSETSFLNLNAACENISPFLSRPLARQDFFRRFGHLCYKAAEATDDPNCFSERAPAL